MPSASFVVCVVGAGPPQDGWQALWQPAACRDKAQQLVLQRAVGCVKLGKGGVYHFAKAYGRVHTKALREMHTHVLQQGQRRVVLNKLGDDCFAESLPNIGDGANHGAIGLIPGNIAHKTAIDFQQING